MFVFKTTAKVVKSWEFGVRRWEFFCLFGYIFIETAKNPYFCFAHLIKSRTFAPLLENNYLLHQQYYIDCIKQKRK